MTWATPISDKIGKTVLFHDDVLKLLVKRKRLTPYGWLSKVVIRREIHSYLVPFKLGEFFWGSSKIGLTTFTWYEIARDTQEAYKKTKNSTVARNMFLHQTVKWFGGMVIGAVGHDFGYELHPKKGLLTGFICAIISSAIFDYFWNKPEPQY